MTTILILEVCSSEYGQFYTELIKHYVGEDIDDKIINADYKKYLKKTKKKLSAEYNDGNEEINFCDEFYEFSFNVFII